MRLKLFAVGLIFITGCSSIHHTTLPEPGTTETGILEIKIANPEPATVLIDDREIETPSNKIHSVTIDSIPVGLHKVNVLVGKPGAAPWSKEDSIRIYPDQKSTMIADNPSTPASYNWGRSLVVSVVAYLIALSIIN